MEIYKKVRDGPLWRRNYMKDVSVKYTFVDSNLLQSDGHEVVRGVTGPCPYEIT
jgi:hypothetical protein